MMEISASIEKVSEIASTSSAFVGFLGGFIKALTNGKGIRDGIIKIVTGCTIAWVSSPVAVRYLPSELYPPAMFMLGFGGIEFIEFVKNIFEKIVENRAEVIVDKLFGKSNTAVTVRQEHLPAVTPQNFGVKRNEQNVI